MKPLTLLNYARDQWIQGAGQLADVPSAVNGEVVAATGSSGLDFKAMLDHARASAACACAASPSTSARIC
jgi:oxepin-CoA hydrolase/3-oxo-5,6-dehydrosuberyl-CoA semialdehyde dehydrogenase